MNKDRQEIEMAQENGLNGKDDISSIEMNDVHSLQQLNVTAPQNKFSGVKSNLSFPPISKEGRRRSSFL